jgi:DDE superfamily endonuclease
MDGSGLPNPKNNGAKTWISSRIGLEKIRWPKKLNCFQKNQNGCPRRGGRSRLNGQTLYKCRKLKMPHKKPRKRELAEEQKLENKEISSERVIVEHSIGGLKRYRILSDRLRMRNYDLYNDVLEICAGLWNFTIST